MPTLQTFTVTFEALPSSVPIAERAQRLLKHALRARRFRMVRMSPLPPDPERPTATDLIEQVRQRLLASDAAPDAPGERQAAPLPAADPAPPPPGRTLQWVTVTRESASPPEMTTHEPTPPALTPP